MQQLNIQIKTNNTPSSVLVLPQYQHSLKMGKELVPKRRKNFHILTQLSSRETFSESFTEYNVAVEEGKKNRITGLDRPRGFQEADAPRLQDS